MLMQMKGTIGIGSTNWELILSVGQRHSFVALGDDDRIIIVVKCVDAGGDLTCWSKTVSLGQRKWKSWN